MFFLGILDVYQALTFIRHVLTHKNHVLTLIRQSVTDRLSMLAYID